jgi:hypothetical protein
MSVIIPASCVLLAFCHGPDVMGVVWEACQMESKNRIAKNPMIHHFTCRTGIPTMTKHPIIFQCSSHLLLAISNLYSINNIYIPIFPTIPISEFIENNFPVMIPFMQRCQNSFHVAIGYEQFLGGKTRSRLQPHRSGVGRARQRNLWGMAGNKGVMDGESVMYVYIYIHIIGVYTYI